ncbi:hypothetical protein GCM10010104_25890 [Streptomyces indiaensis]|uniref:Uncharacterized protein n=1 Tax=Streptomyces indiaensis TaxID=284033 RepID=A0ABN3DH81_9ACTN
MPVTLTEDIHAVADPFCTRWNSRRRTSPGPPSRGLGLWRSSAVLDRVGVADIPGGCVTELKVLGHNALDVHLLLGEQGMP